LLSLSTQAGAVPVLVLKEGSNRSRGKEAQHSNIMAAKVVAESVKSALGPKGMDKMLVDSFGDVTITSDGRTILDEMDIQHPAAKMMVEVAKTQDNEAGDGTTTAVIISGGLLNKAEELINKNVHPTIIIDGYKKASERTLKILEKIAMSVDLSLQGYLKKAAMTSMASKLVAEHRGYLADLAVKAVLQVAQKEAGKYKADVDDISERNKTD
jgi:chaperonin GroEL (HSP60 family)